MTVMTVESILGTKRKAHAAKAEKLLDLAAGYIENRDRLVSSRWGYQRRQSKRWLDNAMYAVAVAQVEAILATVEQ